MTYEEALESLWRLWEQATSLEAAEWYFARIEYCYKRIARIKNCMGKEQK